MLKVSVIIPTYNRVDSLRKAINSVLEQTYNNIEVVVVDDNLVNSDCSRKVKQICDNYWNIQIVYIKTEGRVGGGRARNMGCSAASGDYFAFLDDDDVFLPEKIEKQLCFTLTNKLDMSFQDVIWRNEKGQIVEYRSFEYIKDCSNESLLKEHLMHNIAPTSIYLISKEAFFSTRGFGDLNVGQDIYLMFDCILNGLKIGYMRGAYVNQYIHSGQRLSTGQSKIDGENWWYKEKQKYLYVLSKREKRFFRFRHYMILFFACLRSGYYLRMVVYGIMAFIISPSDSAIEGTRYFFGKIKHRIFIGSDE